MTETKAHQPKSLEELKALEREISPRYDTGSTHYRFVYDAMEISEDLRGLTVVDLASGASSFVAGLIVNGVNAYGVDRLYEDPQELVRSSTRGVRKVIKGYEEIGEQEMVEFTRRSLSAFSSSFVQNQERYIPGWLTDIPLPDGFADRTYSMHGITLMGVDYDLIMQSLHEAIRITKPGGTIMVAPFNDRPESLDSRYHKVHSDALRSLQKEGFKAESIDSSMGPGFIRLKISR